MRWPLSSYPALTLTNVSAINAGSYSVVITSPYGSVTSAVATLTVRAPPVITVQPTNQVVVPGSRPGFSVTALVRGHLGICGIWPAPIWCERHEQRAHTALCFHQQCRQLHRGDHKRLRQRDQRGGGAHGPFRPPRPRSSPAMDLWGSSPTNSGSTSAAHSGRPSSWMARPIWSIGCRSSPTPAGGNPFYFCDASWTNFSCCAFTAPGCRSHERQAART